MSGSNAKDSNAISPHKMRTVVWVTLVLTCVAVIGIVAARGRTLSRSGSNLVNAALGTGRDSLEQKHGVAAQDLEVPQRKGKRFLGHDHVPSASPTDRPTTSPTNEPTNRPTNPSVSIWCPYLLVYSNYTGVTGLYQLQTDLRDNAQWWLKSATDYIYTTNMGYSWILRSVNGWLVGLGNTTDARVPTYQDWTPIFGFADAVNGATTYASCVVPTTAPTSAPSSVPSAAPSDVPTASPTLSPTQITVTNLERWFTPVGTIRMWAGDMPFPDGWAECDGAVHNGVETPDLRGRFPLGHLPNATVTGPDNRVVGATEMLKVGGDATHVLQGSEMPSHGHGISGGSHSHTSYDRYPEGGGGCNPIFGYGIAPPFNPMRRCDSGRGTSANGHSHSISGSGGDGAHNNVPPFTVVLFIMKVRYIF